MEERSIREEGVSEDTGQRNCEAENRVVVHDDADVSALKASIDNA